MSTLAVVPTPDLLAGFQPNPVALNNEQAKIYEALTVPKPPDVAVVYGYHGAGKTALATSLVYATPGADVTTWVKLLGGLTSATFTGLHTKDRPGLIPRIVIDDADRIDNEVRIPPTYTPITVLLNGHFPPIAGHR